jgi:hypothetical protein
MGMWVATQAVLTACGWVQPGRLVADGDPMLVGVPDGVFVRVVEDGDTIEAATAEPGRRRTTRRTAG